MLAPRALPRAPGASVSSLERRPLRGAAVCFRLAAPSHPAPGGCLWCLCAPFPGGSSGWRPARCRRSCEMPVPAARTADRKQQQHQWVPSGAPCVSLLRGLSPPASAHRQEGGFAWKHRASPRSTRFWKYPTCGAVRRNASLSAEKHGPHRRGLRGAAGAAALGGGLARGCPTGALGPEGDATPSV